MAESTTCDFWQAKAILLKLRDPAAYRWLLAHTPHRLNAINSSAMAYRVRELVGIQGREVDLSALLKAIDLYERVIL